MKGCDNEVNDGAHFLFFVFDRICLNTIETDERASR